jgi:MFS transporter, DHA1 family, multidrug resistance protein
VTLWAALLSGSGSIAMAISSPIWGVLADRYGRKLMVVRATGSAVILVGLMGVATSVYQLLLLRILMGLLTGTITASQALVSSQVPRERLGFSLGVMQTAIFVGSSAGPLLGGLIAQAVGFRLSFAAAAALLFLSTVLVLVCVQEEPRFTQQAPTIPHPTLLAGMRAVLAVPVLLSTIGAIFVVQFATTQVYPILPQFVQLLEGPTGHAALATGLILAGAGGAGALSSTAIGWFSDRIGYTAILITAALAAACLSVPQSFVHTTWQLGVLRVADGVALGAMLPAASAMLGNLVPPAQRGAAYGLASSATSLGMAAGPLTTALVVAVSGIRAVFLVAAVLLGFIAVWVSVMIRLPEQGAVDATGSVPKKGEPASDWPAGN